MRYTIAIRTGHRGLGMYYSTSVYPIDQTTNHEDYNVVGGRPIDPTCSSGARARAVPCRPTNRETVKGGARTR